MGWNIQHVRAGVPSSRPSSTPEEAAEGMPCSLTMHHLHVFSWNRLTLFQTGRCGQRRAIPRPLHLPGACCLQPVKDTNEHEYMAGFWKLAEHPWNVFEGQRVALVLICLHLHSSKHGRKHSYPWLSLGLTIRILDIVSWEWLETVRKICKFGRLRDSFCLFNLQMKCKFWSIGDLHKLTKITILSEQLPITSGQLLI